MPNIVYVLTNEAMPGLVKIGLTTDKVESRIGQLSNHSGVPLPFECYFAAEVDSCEKLEKILHQLFSEHRINPKREFFKIDPEKVVLAISIGRFKEVTPGATEVDRVEQDALEKIKARRPPLKINALGIKPDDILTFSRDDTITTTVVDGGKVSFQGEILSLSAAAVKALRMLNYGTANANGALYWKFDDELLVERRQRIEANPLKASNPSVNRTDESCAFGFAALRAPTTDCVDSQTPTSRNLRTERKQEHPRPHSQSGNWEN